MALHRAKLRHVKQLMDLVFLQKLYKNRQPCLIFENIHSNATIFKCHASNSWKTIYAKADQVFGSDDQTYLRHRKVNEQHNYFGISVCSLLDECISDVLFFCPSFSGSLLRIPEKAGGTRLGNSGSSPQVSKFCNFRSSVLGSHIRILRTTTVYGLQTTPAFTNAFIGENSEIYHALQRGNQEEIHVSKFKS